MIADKKAIMIKSEYGIPLLLFLLGLAVTVMAYQFERKSFDGHVRLGVESNSERLVEHFSNLIQPTLNAVERIAIRWESTKGTTKDAWTSDAKAYIRDFKFIHALEWVDKNNIVRWVEPLHGNEQALGFDLGSNKARKKAIESSKLHRQSFSSKVVNLRQGGKGFLSFFPIHYEGQHQGFILAVFKVQNLIDHAFAQSKLNYKLFENGELIGENNSAPMGSNKYTVVRTLKFSNLDWTIEFFPKNDFVNQAENESSNAVLYMGVIGSSLMSILSFLFLTLRAKSQEQNRALQENEILNDKLESALQQTKQQQLKLGEINERFELALEASGIGVWDYFIKENRLIWDEQMYSIYGVNTSDFEGAYEAWANGLHPDDREESEQALKDALEGKKTFEPHFRVRWPDGSVRHVQAKAKVIHDESGTPVRMLGVNWDITRQNQIEVSLRNAIETKSLFLANMSHEIRTPLNGILSCSNLLMDGATDPEDIKLLTTVHSCGDSLLNVINDILDYSKVESGNIDLEVQPFQLTHNISEIVDLLQPKATEANRPLTLKMGEDVPMWIIGDVTRFRQVLLNLIGNAIKFSKNRVEIKVSAKILEDEKCEINISVIDDGIGIPNHAIDKLFDSFKQVDASTTRKFGGTGLGLAICKGIVDAMGGHIKVESELGSGSQFSFVFTTKRISKKPLETKPNSEAIFDENMAVKHPLKIMMAEDNSVNQMVGKKMLAKLGYRIDVVSNGIEALELIRKQSYDLILMDQHMPEMDGLEATKKIRSDSSSRPGPRIVALTASAFKEDRERCFAAGMDGFLSKPIRMTELTRELLACNSDLDSGNSPSIKKAS